MTNALAQAAKLMQAGRFAEAEALYRQAAQQSPAQSPTGADARFGLGLALESQNRFGEAEAAYREALTLRPGFTEAACNLGSLLLRSERSEEALPVLQSAAQAKPGFLPAQINLGLACLALGRASEAETALRAALSLEPSHPVALNELGRALLQQTKVEEAVALFREGRRRHPKEARFLANLANALEIAGDLEGAQDALDEARRLAPGAPALLFATAKLARRRNDLAGAQAALSEMLEAKLPQAERADGLLELGQVLEEQGEASDAFARFAEGNRLRAATPAARRHDGQAFLARVAAIAEALEAGDFDRPAADDDATTAPVFFVGFPRSGTSLMEQALQAHPSLITTGERSPLGPILSRLTAMGVYPERIATLSDFDIAAARDAFWRGAETLVGPLADRVLIDKTALNIVHLGLVNLLFPNARVLVALRDPRDVCLSCFMQRFQLSEATVNFLDLARTAESYAAVMGLWQAYDRRLPLAQHSYPYEDLVEDFEGTLRVALAFIGVGWDAQVLSFRDSAARQQVTTPSYHQVAKPLYGRARGRWRRYEQEIAPILPGLRPFAEAFGYAD